MASNYIAYGSNLSVEQMEYRCPDAKVVGTAVLKDWKLVFRYHADIKPCRGAETPVLVWAVSAADERRLDRYEGFPSYYVKKIVQVVMDGTGEKLDGMVYIMTDMRGTDLTPPAQSYYEIIEGGYERFGFDKTILRNARKESE